MFMSLDGEQRLATRMRRRAWQVMWVVAAPGVSRDAIAVPDGGRNEGTRV